MCRSPSGWAAVADGNSFLKYRRENLIPLEEKNFFPGDMGMVRILIRGLGRCTGFGLQQVPGHLLLEEIAG